jgi:hypothetical protein
MSVSRFLYVNLYAFLLLAGGAFILWIPERFFITGLKILAGIYLASTGCAMLYSWGKKARMMGVLRGRNNQEIRPETFKKHSQTLCGRLMVNAVLMDLRKNETYRNVSVSEWKAYRNKALQKRARKASRKKSERRSNDG